MPIRAKGRKYPFELACVAWVDLLGYGSMLELAKFHPSDPRTSEAVSRLKTFQQTAIQGARRSFRAMTINDGVAYFTDLSPRTTSVTADFLKRAIQAHGEINAADQGAGYPGARMVISVGPRIRIGRPKRSELYLEGILGRLNRGTITAERAILEAFKTDPVAGFVPALQANFAFTRAYLADAGGSKAGIGGASCYIDLALFKATKPFWMTFEREQSWSGLGLDVTFGKLGTVDWKNGAKRNFPGIKSTMQIAQDVGITSPFTDFIKDPR